MKIIRLYLEFIPESYNEDGLVVTLRCKKSNQYNLAYDLRCVLYDALDKHPMFKDIKIIEENK